MKLKYYYIVCFFACLLNIPNGYAQQDSIYRSKSLDELYHRVDLPTILASKTPAFLAYTRDRSFSSVSLETNYQQASDWYTYQLGNQAKSWGLNGSSFVHLDSSSTAWGGATYDNGSTYQVNYNETSDYDLLYPYVMADTIGGTLDHETYAFYGGYAYHKDKYSIAAQLDYRAHLAYRKVDPRTKNIVSDLNFTLSASRSLFYRYRAALSLNVGKYKQSNELDFYSPLGNSLIYHLTGMGNHYARFAGMKKNVLYDGMRWGATISLMPIKRRGAFANLSYSHFGVDKQLSDLGNIELNELSTTKYEATVGLALNSSTVQVSGKYLSKDGDDLVYGQPLGTNYPFLDRFNNYHHSAYQLEATYQQTLFIHSSQLITDFSVGACSYEEEHVPSSQSTKLESVTPSLRLNYLLPFKDVEFGVEAFCAYRFNYTADTSLLANASSVFSKAAYRDYQIREANQFTSLLKLNIVFPRLIKHSELTANVSWENRSYLSNHSSHFNLGVGVTF